MVSTCANPECSVQLHDLQHGKLFLLDMRALPSGVEPPMFTVIQRQIRYVWLCESCAKTMHVVYDEKDGVRVETLFPRSPSHDELQEGL